MKNCIMLVALVLASTAVDADLIELEYGAFYSHVKKLTKDETSALQFAFGFKHVETGSLCQVKSAEIITDKQTIGLNISEEQRFLVPSEKALKLAKAVVRIEVLEADNQCDMSVQLETKPDYLKSTLTADELRFLLSQYEAFFDTMGSFLSFLMPSVNGLRLELAVGTTTEASLEFDDGAAILSRTWLMDNQTSLSFSQAPTRITAVAN